MNRECLMICLLLTSRIFKQVVMFDTVISHVLFGPIQGMLFFSGEDKPFTISRIQKLQRVIAQLLKNGAFPYPEMGIRVALAHKTNKTSIFWQITTTQPNSW